MNEFGYHDDMFVARFVVMLSVTVARLTALLLLIKNKIRAIFRIYRLT